MYMYMYMYSWWGISGLLIAKFPCTVHVYWFLLFSSNFWEVFYEFDEDEKKQLLAFVTGSDRVPVGGLSNLKLVIVKNGPDSDRYYTTCTVYTPCCMYMYMYM